MSSEPAVSLASSASLSPVQQTFLKNIGSPWKLKLYFLKNLPTAAWWGLRLKSINQQKAEVTIPYNWRTQNPFQSIYFAALAGAGELSMGLLANLARAGKQKTSMLVIDQKSEFVKKAASLITFTCEQGQEVMDTVQRAIDLKEPQTITMVSSGRNTSGEVVCRIFITWSFKAKS